MGCRRSNSWKVSQVNFKWEKRKTAEISNQSRKYRMNLANRICRTRNDFYPSITFKELIRKTSPAWNFHDHPWLCPGLIVFLLRVSLPTGMRIFHALKEVMIIFLHLPRHATLFIVLVDILRQVKVEIELIICTARAHFERVSSSCKNSAML